MKSAVRDNKILSDKFDAGQHADRYKNDYYKMKKTVKVTKILLIYLHQKA